MVLLAGLSRQIYAFRSLITRTRSQSDTIHENASLTSRLVDVFLRTWDLGLIAFGGPPVHFQILHQRFVEGRGGKAKWVDEQTVSEEP
jgi:hypothetical protein